MSLERYARSICGNTPEGVADWQLVARELYDRHSELPSRLLDNSRDAVNEAFDYVERVVGPFTKAQDLTVEQLQSVPKLLQTLRRVSDKIAKEFMGSDGRTVIIAVWSDDTGSPKAQAYHTREAALRDWQVPDADLIESTILG